MTEIKVTVGNFAIDQALKKVIITGNGPVTGFEIFLNDNGNASQQPQLTAGAPVSIYVNSPATGNIDTLMMKGKLVDKMPKDDDDTAVQNREATLMGLNNSRDLLRLKLISTPQTNFKNAPIKTIFSYPLAYLGSVLTAVPYPDASIDNAIVELLEANDQALIDLYNPASDKVGYGYTVNWDTDNLVYWRLDNTPEYGILLKNLPNDPDNNILTTPEKGEISSSVKNYFIIKAGGLTDQWTEETAQYIKTSKLTRPVNQIVFSFLPSSDNSITVFDDYTTQTKGKASIRVHCENVHYYYSTGALTSISMISFAFPFLNCPVLDFHNIASTQCSVDVSHDKSITGLPDNCVFVIVIVDTKGNIMYWFSKGHPQEWTKVNFVLGYNAPKVSTANFMRMVEGCWYPANDISFDDFNWEITSLNIGFLPANVLSVELPNVSYSGYFTGNFWIDGLNIPSSEATNNYVIAQDAESIAIHGKSMAILFRPDLISIPDMIKVGQQEIAAGKDGFEKLTLITKLQPKIRFAGLLLDVHYPEMGIGSGPNAMYPAKYRVTSFAHTVHPKECDVRNHEDYSQISMIKADINETNPIISASRLLHASNPSYAAYQSNETRIAVLENNAANPNTGSGVAGGGGGSDWSGGVVSQTIDVQCKMPFLNEQNNDVYRWLMTPQSQLQDYSAFINFHNIAEPGASVPNLMQDLNLYGVFVSNGTDHNPGLMVGHHLLFRGDFMGRGVMSSLEGVVILHGGRIPAGVPGAGGKVCGWAPSENPMIWLAQGSNNANARTLEIRLGVPGGWGWGNLEAANLTAHGNIFADGHLEANNILANGFVGTNNLSTRSGYGQITLHSGLAPSYSGAVSLGAPNLRYDYVYSDHMQCGDLTAINGIRTQDIYSSTNGQNLFHYEQSGNKITLNGNVTVTGTLTLPSGAANPFDQLLNTYNAVTFTDVTMTGSTTISGNITCHGALDVNWLRADGPYAIGLNSSIVPVGTSDLGSQNNYFQSIWTAMACYKDKHQFNCERNLSGQECKREIQNEQDALEILTHEVTKPLYHTTYNLEAGKEDEMICTCGKSVKTPCPEHKKEWLDKYTRNTGKQEEAVAFLTLEHAAKIARLETALSEANEKIAHLEQQRLSEVKAA